MNLRLVAAMLVLSALLSGCADKADDPVNGSAKGEVATSTGDSTDLSKLTLKDLFDRTRQLDERERQIQADMQRDIDETKARLGARVHDPSSNSEAIRIRQTWPPKIQAVEAQLELVNQEIQRRCPNGANLNSDRQVCS